MAKKKDDAAYVKSVLRESVVRLNEMLAVPTSDIKGGAEAWVKDYAALVADVRDLVGDSVELPKAKHSLHYTNFGFIRASDGPALASFLADLCREPAEAGTT